MRISDWSSDVCSSDLGGIGASLLCVARQQDRFLGRVGAGSGDHQNTAFGGLDAEGRHPHVLLVRKRRRLAGGPAGHQGARAFLDLPFYEVLKGLFIQPPITKRCNERGDRARENRSEEHTSELQSLMRISYAVFCLTKKKQNNQ